VGLIERYRDQLPFAVGDPIISLEEGQTPVVRAESLSAWLGAEIWLKIEGANPTGSFKDRGMTCAVSAAVRDGTQALICASTGNTSASAAAYGARAGLATTVVVPEGKIAPGKLAQALMYGAQVLSIDGNFDAALTIVRRLADEQPISLVNSVNEFRIQGQKTAAFELMDVLGEVDGLAIPVGNGGNISAYGLGFRERQAEVKLFGFQAEGSAPLVVGHAIEQPETVATAIRIGNPARGERAMDEVTRSGGAIRALSDQEILAAQRFIASSEGIFCEPASAASVAGLIKYGVGECRRIVCVLTGNGLKDPDTALGQVARPVRVPADFDTIAELVLAERDLESPLD
jgi:threonine synthase